MNKYIVNFSFFRSHGKFNVLIHGKFAILLTYHEIFVHKPLLVFSNGAKFQVLLSKPIYISFC